MTTRVDLGARRSTVGMFTAGYVFCDNYTAATEGKRQYSYEKEPVSSDKQLRSESITKRL